MRQQEIVRSRRKEPPLEMTERVDIDAESGATTRVVRYRRGVIVREVREYSSVQQWCEALSQSPRQLMESWCEAIRDMLGEHGIPSDRQWSWFRDETGKWHHITKVPKDRIKPGTALAIWYARMKAVTEPLSELREAGEFLWDLTRLLERKGIDEHLWHICQLLGSYRAMHICGPVNAAAAEGLNGRRARAKGPLKKRERSKAICEVVRQHAEQYWHQFSLFRGDASNTAQQIVEQVNRALRERGLLSAGKRDLKSKTIADYIRTANGGNSV